MAETPFDWNEEVVAVPRQRAIAVYLNERFDVVIRQQGENGAPDAVIEVASGINCLELASAILDFRFHDKRHDFATKLLRESRNLKLVQKPRLVAAMLNPVNGRTVRMFRCKCGEQTWSEDRQ
jgi:hypothetical protein